MDFELQPLSEELLFVRWHSKPTAVEQDTYLYELEMRLDKAHGSLYVICDESEGCLSDRLAKQNLAALTRHPRWGGSVSYGHAHIRASGAGRLRRAASIPERDASVPDVEDALDYLEALKPGITAHSIDRYALETLYG